MTSKIQDWQDKLDVLTTQFQATFGGLSADQLNWKPTGDVWSIGQNIEHLITLNRTFYPELKAARKGIQKIGFLSRMGFLQRFFGNFILKASEPTRKKKIKTFPVWEPEQSNIPADILAQFEEHQTELKQIIADSEDLLHQKAVIRSPANKNIVYSVEMLFEIIVTHEERHLNQAKEVLALSKEI